jgi:hypothetical protein
MLFWLLDHQLSTNNKVNWGDTKIFSRNIDLGNKQYEERNQIITLFDRNKKLDRDTFIGWRDF